MNYKIFRIAAILIENNTSNIEALQDLFSTYGNVIRSRLGITDPVENEKIKGLIILELSGDQNEINGLLKEIKNKVGLKVQDMEFEDFI